MVDKLRSVLIALILLSGPVSTFFIGYSLKLAYKALPWPVWGIGMLSILTVMLGLASLIDRRAGLR